MPELVFYDQRLPLKRKWSEGASPPPLLAMPMPMPPLRPLPRLPSLSAWANVKPAPMATTAVFPASVTPSPASVPASVTTHATSPPSPPTEKKPAAPMRNTSRERMKAEQAALRAQAATLETELTCLRQLRHERLSASLRSSGSSSSSSEPPSEGLLGWQEMAQRHWDQRVASERENKRLREAVNGLATEVKGLEALFNSRSSALMASLKQNALLAVQIQELLHKCERSPTASPTAASRHSHKKLKTQPPSSSSSSSSSSSHAQSPRDVACAAMEAPQSPYGL